MSTFSEPSSFAGQLRSTLAAVQRHQQNVWWSGTILGVVGALGLTLLAAVLLDQYLVLPAVGRLVLLTAVIVAPLLVVRRSLQSRPSGSLEDTALLVERRYPELDNLLINTLQFASRTPDGAEDIVGAIGDEARSAVTHINPTAAVAKRSLAIAAGATGVAMVVLIVSMAVNGSGFGRGLGRVLFPFGRNTLTQIKEVTPGGADVLVNSDITVAATVAGQVPTQADLVCTLADGRKMTVPMLASPARPDRLVGKIDRVESDTRYQVLAGDDKSSIYEVRVHDRPSVRNIVQTITPPEYVLGKPVEQAGGSVQALTGSKVKLVITASEPLKEGWLTLGGGKRMQISNGAVSETGVDAVADLLVEKPDRYTIELTSAAGFTSEPATYDITPIPDQPPKVEFIAPTAEVTVGIDAKVKIEIRAGDDYAVRRIELVRLPNIQAAPVSDGQTPTTQPAAPHVLASWDIKTRDQSKVNQSTTVAVAELGLTADAPIILQALAYDFRPNSQPGASGLVTLRLDVPPEPSQSNAGNAGKVSLEALIAKQRANIASGQAYAAWIKDSTKTKPTDDLAAMATRQETLRGDAIAILADKNTNALIRQRLTNLSETLMVVAVEQLRTAAAVKDAAAPLKVALGTEELILRTLMGADAAQDEEISKQNQHAIEALLAELIAKQQVVRNDTAGKDATNKALGARQMVLARDVARLQAMIKTEAEGGAGGNTDMAERYTKALALMDERAIRANMLVAVESLDKEARPDALAKQEKALADLLDVQKIIRDQALEEAKKEAEKLASGLSEAKARLDRMVDLQAKLTEIAKDLKKAADLTEGKMEHPQELAELSETRTEIADALEKLAKDLHLLPDTSASNDLLAEANEVYESVKQAPGSADAPVSEVAVDRDEGTLAALKEMQKHMGERIADMEMWMPNAPDATRWKQESYDKDELGKIPLGDLPDKLDDIVGDLLDQNEELSKEADDSASNVGLPDAPVGWDIADGPMPSWAAKGKSGNEKPNNMEQTGRSGSGRQGKSDGEIVGDTIKALKGGDVETRRTNDAFQKGELKEEDPGAMDVKATGGGKLAGTSDSEGMNGDAPPRDELKYREMQRNAAKLKHDAETIYSKAKLLRLPTGELDRAILEMDASQRRLASGDVEGFAKGQKEVVKALRNTQAKLTGQAVTKESSARKNEPDAAGATGEPVPKQYEDAVADYMRSIAEGQ